MTRSGRPLRFLLLVVGGWTGARTWWLWPSVPTLPALIHAVAPLARLAAGGSLPPAERPQVAAAPMAGTRHPSGHPRVLQTRVASRNVEGAPARSEVALVPAPSLRFADPVPDARLPSATTRLVPSGSRLSGTAWLLARGGPALAGGLAGAQLGGSQAGVRLAFAVDRARRLAIVGRLTTAIGGSGAPRLLSDREGAIGLAWRPTRLPVTLVAEQRFVFEAGGHGGPTVAVLAGLPSTPIAAGFRLEAYGQAGAIARSGAGNTVEAFGDGAARLTRPVTVGRVRLDVGAGAWGGAQRGAARVDLGPTLGASLPVAHHAVRLALDWRERIAGGARPGSGPALSLGTDF